MCHLCHSGLNTMIPNFGMVYLSAWNLTACRVAFVARHQVLVWSRFFCDGFKNLFSISLSLLFLIFFIAVIIWFSSYPLQTKIKLILSPATNTFASIYFNNFSILYLCIFLSIYPSTLSMLRYIINATVNNLCRII